MTESAQERADENPLEDPHGTPDQNPDLPSGQEEPRLDPDPEGPGPMPRRGFDEGSETLDPSGETRPSLDTDGNPDRIGGENPA